jgi:hypothetical protein
MRRPSGRSGGEGSVLCSMVVCCFGSTVVVTVSERSAAAAAAAGYAEWRSCGRGIAGGGVVELREVHCCISEYRTSTSILLWSRKPWFCRCAYEKVASLLRVTISGNFFICNGYTQPHRLRLRIVFIATTSFRRNRAQCNHHPHALTSVKPSPPARTSHMYNTYPHKEKQPL